MNFDIAVVIPVFNESYNIQRALSLFSTNTGGRVLLVVVDNGSNDSTLTRINDWHRKNHGQPLIMLSEKRKGSLYARKKGLDFAKSCAPVAISTDADCWPLTGFYNHIRSSFSMNTSMDVLIGRERHESQTRLLKQLYLPRLMNLIAWQEYIEIELFGPFFFGGYFGIKTNKINDVTFSIQNIPIPQEPSVYWSRHCHYLGYTFMQSKPNMRTSSRRLWTDPYGFNTNQHSKIVRTPLPNHNEQKRMFVRLQKKEHDLISLRQKHFAYRLLMFMLDGIFFEKIIVNKTIVSKKIEKSCKFLEIDPAALKKITTIGFIEAKKRILENSNHVLNKIKREYQHKSSLYIRHI